MSLDESIREPEPEKPSETQAPSLQDLALAAASRFLEHAPSPTQLGVMREAMSAIESKRRLAKLSPVWTRALEALLRRGALTRAQCDAAIETRQADEPLLDTFLRSTGIDEQILAEALARASTAPLVSLTTYPTSGSPLTSPEAVLAPPQTVVVDPVAARLVSRGFAEARSAIVVAVWEREGAVVMADPADEIAFREVQHQTGLKLYRLTGLHAEIVDALEHVWSPRADAPTMPRSGTFRNAAPFFTGFGTPLVLLGAFFLYVFRDALNMQHLFAVLALLCGFFFFSYALKYYLTTAAVLAVALFGDPLKVFKRNGNGRHENGDGKSPFASLATGNGNGNGSGNGHGSGNGNGQNGHGKNGHGYKTLRGQALDEVGAIIADATSRIGENRLPPEKQPFVSVHLATYNERRVIDRLLTACTSFDYDNYEVIVADDSTDETVEALAKWQSHPRVKVLHRTNRIGFKGGALQNALDHTHPGAEYVMIFDADFIPPADAIWHFLDYFGRLPAAAANGNGQGNGNGNGNGHHENANGNGGGNGNGHHENGNGNGNGNGHHGNGNGNGNGHPRYINGIPVNGERLAAVQGYQWHMLNASENWVTKGVRAEFSGSYVLERAAQELFGTMKMISGSVYMIRADVLKRLGWSTSITEDWELSIRLYLAGYKVLYTPYIQAPAECVSKIRRLIKQRERWSEGHTYNVKKYLWPILTSPNMSFREKLEFIYYAPYYLQATIFTAGTLCWLLGVFLLGQRLPQWGEVLGWSLVVSNALALLLMNFAGLILEGSVRRDWLGLLSFIGLSFILVPFQAWAALRGLLQEEEGGWVRTPKSGRVTESLAAFKLAKLFPWELPKRRKKPSKAAQITLACIAGALAVAVVGIGVLSMRAVAATGAAKEPTDYTVPMLATAVALALLGAAWFKLKRRLTACVLIFGIAASTNIVFLANTIPASAVASNDSTFYFRNSTTLGCTNRDMLQSAPTSATDSTEPGAKGKVFTFCSDTFDSTQSIAGGTVVITAWFTNTHATSQCTVTMELQRNATLLGSQGFLIGKNTTTITEITWNINISGFTFATGDRLNLLVKWGGTNGCANTTLYYDSTGRPARMVTTTIVPEGLLPLILLAPALPFALRRWLHRRRERPGAPKDRLA